jgi:hypothetical protein
MRRGRGFGSLRDRLVAQADESRWNTDHEQKHGRCKGSKMGTLDAHPRPCLSLPRRGCRLLDPVEFPEGGVDRGIAARRTRRRRLGQQARLVLFDRHLSRLVHWPLE